MEYSKEVSRAINLKIIHKMWEIDPEGTKYSSLEIAPNAYSKEEILELENRHRLLGFNTQIENYTDAMHILYTAAEDTVSVKVISEDGITLPEDCSNLFEKNVFKQHGFDTVRHKSSEKHGIYVLCL